MTGSRAVDIKAAIVEHFQERAAIFIATEAAAEGVNLQFCSLVVNYDLPWNPQRIEQRIGRCHRYGQKHDVVVVNFLNRRNEADQRVFEILSEKFRLFDGVFGASDEVLGALESGVDIERRIALVYQTCRNTEEIKTAFDKLQSELDEQIQARMAQTRVVLLENFDDEVLKLDRWSDDLKTGLEREIKELDRQIREARKTSALTALLKDKLEAQRTLKSLEGERNRKRRELFDAQDAIDGQRDELIKRIEGQLHQTHTGKTIFLFRWRLA